MQDLPDGGRRHGDSEFQQLALDPRWQLMAELLPDSPRWHNIGSSVTHSIYWGLRDVDGSRPGER